MWWLLVLSISDVIWGFRGSITIKTTFTYIWAHLEYLTLLILYNLEFWHSYFVMGLIWVSIDFKKNYYSQKHLFYFLGVHRRICIASIKIVIWGNKWSHLNFSFKKWGMADSHGTPINLRLNKNNKKYSRFLFKNWD